MNVVDQSIQTISNAIPYPKSPEVRDAFKTLRTALGVETAFEDDKGAGSGAQIGAPVGAPTGDQGDQGGGDAGNAGSEV